MADDVGQIGVFLDVETGAFSTKMSGASGDVQKFGKAVEENTPPLDKMEKEADELSRTMGKLRSAFLGLAGFKLAKDTFTGLVQAQKDMQQIHFGLQGALGSTRAAADAFEYVSEVSERLGLNLQAAAMEFMKLSASATAMSVPMEEQQKLFEGLARSATVLHLSTDQVKFATMALSQMFGKGKIQAEELRRQLGEQIPGVVPRFQRAVLAMTKDIDDLADKSFDDLLRMGALATDQFLPALSQALEETGRGAEEAAKGLNANLNRLATNWFKFKAEASTGLFTDTVIAGVKLLAENISAIANAALAAGAAIAAIQVSRLAGKGVDAGTSHMKQAIDRRKAAQMNVQSELMEQKAAQATAIKKHARAKAALDEIAQQRQLLAARAAAAQAELGQAQSALRAARGRAQLSGFSRSYRLAVQQEATAKRELNRTMREFATLAQWEQRAKAQLTAQNAAYRASVEGITAAQRRQMALGFLPTLGRGLMTAGRGLLALVGGPWGALTLAVTGIAFAFVNARRKAEEARQAFREQVEELELLALEISDMREIFERGGAEVGIQQMATMWNAAFKEVRDGEAQIAALEQRIESLTAKIEYAKTSNRDHHALTIAADYRQLEEAQAQLEELRNKVGPTRDEFVQLEESMRRHIRPDLFERMREAALKADDVEFNKLRTQLTEVERKALDASGALQKMLQQGEDDKWKASVEYLRRTQGEYRAWLAERGRIIKAQGGVEAMTPEQRRQHAEDAAFFRMHFARMEALKEQERADKDATREAEQSSRARERMIQSITDRIHRQTEANQELLDTNEKMTPTQRLLVRLEQDFANIKGELSGATREQIRTALDKLRQQGEEVRLTERQLAAERSLAALRDQLNDRAEMARQGREDDLLNVGRGDREAEQARRLLAIQRERARQIRDLNIRAKDLSPEDRAKERQQIEQAHQQELALETQHQQNLEAARGDWRNGWNRAWANFRDAATDTASQVESVVGQTFDSLTNFFTEWVTTGKASFKEFATSILSEITRILTSRALAQLVDILIGMWGPGSMSQGTTVTGGASLGYTASANGNVMTPVGPAKLNYYEKGGIARSPQVSIFGEGRTPEAYVPLPDGRSIPVTMQGGGSGGSQVNSVQVNVHIDNNGSAKQTSQTSNVDTGRQLGKMISDQVKETLVQESRQGGLLWRMKNA